MSANSSNAEISYTYNGDGIRTQKIVDGVVHTYQLNGSQIVTESWGTHLLIYLYDAEGSPIGMQYRNTSYAKDYFQTFWFEKNLQGDIVAVYNANGVKLISYTYDAWGNFATTYYNGCNPTSVASYNPFRYRGYYYDSELGMYYLQSRYYDPEVGRFINADAYISTGQGLLGNNMFAYCNNNPVCMADYNGEDAIYVVTTGEEGLPIVGHAILFIQDADGNWYKTHFTGPSKADARVCTEPISEQKMWKFLSSAGVSYIYISGDFTGSYELAQQYSGTNYEGYDLFTNNCLHYVKELLRAGSTKYISYHAFFNSRCIIPTQFYRALPKLRIVYRSNSKTGAMIDTAINIMIYRGEHYVY